MNHQDDTTMNKDEPDSIYRAPTSETSFAPAGDLLASYVGPRNADYYARQFGRFKNKNSSVSWNWPAFFVAAIWLLYRKMWLLALGYWIGLPIALNMVRVIAAEVVGVPASGLLYFILYLAIYFVLMPMYANRLYYRHALKKSDKVKAMTSSPEQQSAELARIGGTSNVALIVLLVLLIPLIGILAGIGIPAYQDYTIRSQIIEGLNLSGSAKTAVAGYYSQTGELGSNNNAVGLPPANRMAGNYVTGVEVIDGDVVITYGNQANAVISGMTVVMTPEPLSESDLQWDCGSPSIKPKYLPAACR